MQTPSLLIAACLLLSSTLLSARRDHRVLRGARRRRRRRPRVRRRAVRCDPARPAGLPGPEARRPRAGNGRACADCHMPTTASSSPRPSAEARFQLLQWRRRFNPTPTIRCSGRSTPTTSGSSATTRTTSATCARTDWCASRSRCRRTCRLIDPATNAPSADTFVDVWRSVPTVNDVALTGPDGINPWPRGPNVSGGYQLDGRFGDPAGAGARGLHRARPGRQCPAAGDARRSGVLPADPVHQPPRPRAVRRPARGHAAAAGGGWTADRARAGRQGRLRPRLHAVPWRARASRRRRRRRSGSTTSPASVRGRSTPRSPARFAFTPCPPQLARNARTYEITLPNGTTVRRTSSDPGRALLTGFVGGAPAAGRLEQAGHAGAARAPQDGAVLPQQQRGDDRGGGRSLHRVLQAGQW